MFNNRDEAIKETLKWEGGYTNNTADPGGPTNWGITIADARHYWKPDATAADVKKMPKSVAVNIYANKYWKTPFYDCDKLANGVDFAVFDFGVNSGPARAKKYYDKAVGQTPAETVNKLCDARLAFLKGLKTSPVFGKGWGTTVAGVRAKSLEFTKRTVDNVHHKTAGTIIVAGGAAATQVPHPYIIPTLIGVAVLAALVWYGIRWYRKRKSK